MARRVRRGEHRRFGSLRLLPDGRVRFSAWTFPGLLPLDFTTEEENPARSAIWVRWRGEVIMLLYRARYRVYSAGFAYNLSPDALREAVSIVRNAGNGLESWIVPALEHNQASDAVKQTHPETHAIIAELLASARDLPVSAPWRRERREIRRAWAKQLREHPEDRLKAPAPWVLPDADTHTLVRERRRSIRQKPGNASGKRRYR